MAWAEDPPGRALHLEARRPLQMRGEFCIGPVRAIEVAALGSLLDPSLHRRRPRLGKPPWSAWGPGDSAAR